MYYESELRHHGIKGMKWGVRRFQNKDGSLTPAGKKRMSWGERRAAKKQLKSDYKKAVGEAEERRRLANSRSRQAHAKAVAKIESDYKIETAPAAAKRDAALAKNKESFDRLNKQTNAYYKSEIDGNMKKAESHDSRAEWWGRESTFGKKYEAQANEYLDKAAKAESRRNEAMAKNAVDNDAKIIAINTKYEKRTKDATERYTQALNNADAKLYSERSKAGKTYYDSIRNAKIDYKQGKQNLKRNR